MKVRITRLAGVGAILGFLFLVQGVAYGQNRIYGQVLTENRRPVADLYVELVNEVNRVVLRTTTDGSGNFIFIGMGTGRFNVRVLSGITDLEEQTQEVQISNLSLSNAGSSDSQQIVFFMRSRRDARGNGVTGVLFAQDIPPDAKKIYEKAIAELNGNRTDAGILGLESAIKIFPQYFLALDRLGVELLKQRKFSEAKNYFERAAAVNSRSANSWYGLALVLFAEDRIKESINAAKKAMEIAPDSPDVYLLLGIAFRKSKEYKDAEQSMLKAKKLSNGKSPDVYWNLALLYRYNLKNNRLAADELENYLKARPNHPEAERLRRLIIQLRNGV